jgi:hypothetical protein
MKTKLLIASMFFGITTLFAQNIPSYVPTNGLVGWWPFNGNANDESGNGNHGTVNGATLATDRNGKSNSAYSFDGISSYISVPNSSSLNITGNQITLSFWLYNMRNDINHKGISKGGWDVGSGYEFLFLEDNGLQLSGNKGGLQRTESVNGAKFLNNWVHLVAVFNNGVGNFYINNVKISANLNGNKFTNFNATDLPLIFGKRSDQIKLLKGFVLGKMDDIAIYNRALSDQEVKMLFNGCSRETATLNATNGVIVKNSNPITLVANPSGGSFVGNTIVNGKFSPTKAKLGSNSVQYLFTNSKGCSDTTRFNLMVYDTIGNVCSSTDTLKINFKLTTGIKVNQLTDIKVYPNPTSELLLLETSDLDALKGYSYNIVDVQGKIIYNKFIQNSLTQIPLNTLGAKGTYILRIIDASGTMIEDKHIVLQ